MVINYSFSVKSIHVKFISVVGDAVPPPPLPPTLTSWFMLDLDNVLIFVRLIYLLVLAFLSFACFS